MILIKQNLHIVINMHISITGPGCVVLVMEIIWWSNNRSYAVANLKPVDGLALLLSSIATGRVMTKFVGQYFSRWIMLRKRRSHELHWPFVSDYLQWWMSTLDDVRLCGCRISRWVGCGGVQFLSQPENFYDWTLVLHGGRRLRFL